MFIRQATSRSADRTNTPVAAIRNKLSQFAKPRRSDLRAVPSVFHAHNRELAIVVAPTAPVGVGHNDPPLHVPSTPIESSNRSREDWDQQAEVSIGDSAWIGIPESNGGGVSLVPSTDADTAAHTLRILGSCQ